ncbi:FAD-binding oxidoreductase [Leucobacter sp. OH1287]|uniref:NAD(P)/FAD-dependent oxidoreductase n=1 Tax=Leucobacter sp. OH1287 TaxID=2491049 RepID=UPI000F5FD2BF|nr:FAD-dependent oxidoreductase [Leucobacter sp. OH1287]RRD60390.1 FAD-dependent oxidoreductase [Leucobacter sp. OH1287]
MINGKTSHWWHQLGQPSRRPGLPGDLTVDVAIVGAGFTGLWTAYYLKQARPNLKIAVIEQEHAGYGASGRNGGWLTNSITGGREQYLKQSGFAAFLRRSGLGRLPGGFGGGLASGSTSGPVSRDTVERFQTLFNQTVTEVMRVAELEGVDADIKRGGEFNVAYTPAQEARLRRFAAAEQRWRSTDLQLLEASEARAKINVAGTRAAIWHPHCARIHPAKLVSGLAEAVTRLGVTIYEGTRAIELESGQVITDHGTVRADFVVRATEGFTANLKGLKRLWLPMNSSMIATEPIAPEIWDEIGWREGETLGDFAHVYMYAQRTADDRIAFGGRGVPYRYGSRTDNDGTTQPVTAQTLGDLLRRFFPQLQNTRIEHLWSGVLGVPRDWSATVGLDRSTGIAWAGGYVGTGVAATNLAGRTLTDLIIGERSELTEMPWVDHRARRWEFEPLRWIATRGLYTAYGVADRQEFAGRKTTSPIAKIADVITGRH